MARTRRQRRRGLRPEPAGRGLLLRAASVHGWGMGAPLGVVSLDAAGRVRRAALLLPRRVLWDRGAAWMIELPLWRRPPEPGMVLRVVHSASAWGGSGYAGIHEAHHGEAAR